MPWVYDPHSGGAKIPPKSYEEIRKQVESYARARPWYPQMQLKARFKSQFCYIDTIEEGNGRTLHLCRLRHFNIHGWSLSLYTYSQEGYEPCAFSDGKMEGTIEAALELCDEFVV